MIDVISNTVERHTQTVVVLVLAALLLWVGNTTQETSVSVAEMRIEVAFLKAAAVGPSPGIKILNERVDRLSIRVTNLENEEK